VLTKRDRVQVQVAASGGASVAGPERLAYSPASNGLCASRVDGLRLALIARWRAPRLDRRLASGTCPGIDKLLAVHGQRITSRRGRAHVADGLARALRDALNAPGFSAAVQPDRQEVLAARTVLAVLDRRLRTPQPVTARGVALLRELLTDGAGPLYQRSEQGALGSRLRTAAAALEPRRDG
jgi:hypothetical protein